MTITNEKVSEMVLLKIGELSARVDATEKEVVALQQVVEEMRSSMATKEQVAEMTSTLTEISKWMNKGSGALWLLATIIPGGIWLYTHWDNIKDFLRAALGIH